MDLCKHGGNCVVPESTTLGDGVALGDGVTLGDGVADLVIAENARLKVENERLRAALEQITTDFLPDNPLQEALALEEMRECAGAALAADGDGE